MSHNQKNTTDIKTHQYQDLRCLDVELAIGVKRFYQFLLVDTSADHTVSPIRQHIKGFCFHNQFY